MTQDHPLAVLDWRDNGTPVSEQFEDPYFSLEDGLAETRHVFLAGNDLPGRFGGFFHIGELGFGTGLNFLATWAAWVKDGSRGTLKFSSFEAYPMALEDMERALGFFPAVAEYAEQLLAQWAGPGIMRFGEAVTLEVIGGDVRDTLGPWDGRVDAWYLDGFSPAKNPEMWGADVMAEVGKHTFQQGTVATYTAAGFVRRALEDAGFDMARAEGFGRKRHMSVGRML